MTLAATVPTRFTEEQLQLQPTGLALRYTLVEQSIALRQPAEHIDFGKRGIIFKNDVRALFWGRERKKRELQPFQRDLSLSAEESTAASVELMLPSLGDSCGVRARCITSGFDQLAALCTSRTGTLVPGGEAVNPFILHHFLLSLEESKGAAPEEGWLPQHLVARDGVGNVLWELFFVPQKITNLAVSLGSLLQLIPQHYNKWGQAYLTRDSFYMMGSRMGDKVLLVMAEDAGELVGGALNLIGGDTHYWRNWGRAPRKYYPSLHFEASCYQRVEAGAQGEHKKRGYFPTAMHSCHYVPDPNFRRALESFFNQETLQMRLALELLEETNPFKEGILENSDG